VKATNRIYELIRFGAVPLRSKKFRGLLALACILCLVGCQAPKTDAPSPPAPKVDGDSITLVPGSKQIDSISVEASEPDDKAVTPITGRLAWNDDATVRVYTPISGRVQKILAEVGQQVESGTPLALIDSPDFGQSQSDALKAESDVDLAQKVLARDQDLFTHGAAAQKDVEADQADLESKKAELQRASAQLAHYGGTLGQINNQYALKAPIAGTVVEKNINPGQQLRDDLILANVQQAYQPLFVISDPNRLWLFLDVTEDDQTKMHQGQQLVLHTRAYPDKEFHGVLEVVGEELDPSTRTLKVRANVDNSEHLLRAEMYVTAELSGVPSGGVTISSKATFRKDDKTYVFVEQAPGDYERKEVKTGTEDNGRIAVSEGLAVGDRVVVEGALSLEQVMEGGGGG
jgi:cobalt-zinc-cadmium efflux system membrane fusion protein